VIRGHSLQSIKRVAGFCGIVAPQGVHGFAKLVLGFGRECGKARSESGIIGGRRLQLKN